MVAINKTKRKRVRIKEDGIFNDWEGIIIAKCFEKNKIEYIVQFDKPKTWSYFTKDEVRPIYSKRI